MKLVFTKQSKADLDEIWDYIAQDSFDRADSFIGQIYGKCFLLSESPAIGRERPELVEGIRSFPVDRYLIFYRIKVDTIFIERVLNGYRDILSLFDKY